MATTLSEMNFELLAPGETEGQVFGIGRDISIDDEGFDPGEDSWTVEDQENPRLGGTSFGRETLPGPTWSFQMHVDRGSTSEAVSSLETFKSAWRCSSLRDTPGAVTTLRYRIGGRTRRVYGRPRRFAAPPSNMILSGYVPITADFQCSTGLTYDDEDQTEVLQLGGAEEASGMSFPVVFPYSSIPARLSSRHLVVGGTEPARPIITFHGPLTNPSLQGPGWTLRLEVAIAANNSITVDLRPWMMTVRSNAGENRAGVVDRRVRLTDIDLPPGSHQLYFTAGSTMTSGTCTVRWANTWNSI